MTRHLVILLIVAAVMVHRTATGARRYAAFKSQTDTPNRIRYYRDRLAGSFCVYVIGGLLTLLLIGQIDALSMLPRDFARAAQLARAQTVIPDIMPSDFVQIAPMIAVAILVVVVIAARRPDGRTLMLGDVGALIPRNRHELGWGALLAINAGIGEELMFRVGLPLLLSHVLHDSPVAFLIATVAFGLTHYYQGWAGMFAATFVGLFLSAEYLSSGSLCFVMAIHAGVNMIGLVIRPVLVELIRRHILHS